LALFGQGERHAIYLPLVINQSPSNPPDLRLYQMLRYRAE
jgi:hypothetical protein